MSKGELKFSTIRLLISSLAFFSTTYKPLRDRTEQDEKDLLDLHEMIEIFTAFNSSSQVRSKKNHQDPTTISEQTVLEHLIKEGSVNSNEITPLLRQKIRVFRHRYAAYARLDLLDKPATSKDDATSNYVNHLVSKQYKRFGQTVSILAILSALILQLIHIVNIFGFNEFFAPMTVEFRDVVVLEPAIWLFISGLLIQFYAWITRYRLKRGYFGYTPHEAAEIVAAIRDHANSGGDSTGKSLAPHPADLFKHAPYSNTGKKAEAV